MHDSALAAFIEQYRAGLEAELAILRRLQRVANSQHEASDSHDIESLNIASNERERLMTALLSIEEPLRPIRLALSQARARARELPGYETALEMHSEALALVSAILKMDEESVEALASAERIRRDTARAVEQGETTLAAYRRVVITRR